MQWHSLGRLCLILCLVLTLPVSAGIEGQENTDEDVESDIKLWNADEPLTWSDFQGQAPNSQFEAQTVWTWQNKTNFIIQCNLGPDSPWVCVASLDSAVITTAFLKEFSWVKPSARNDRVLLAHEQGHFDLGEIYARRLSNAFTDFEVEASDEDRLAAETEAFRQLEELANETVQHWADLAQQEQERYDRETDHGLIASKQRQWENRIRSMLAAEPPAESTD